MQGVKGLAAGESKAIMTFMPEMRATFSSGSMRREKRAVAGNSVLAALVITGLKIVVGIATGSLGILSEAAHSGLDLIAALVTFFSVRVSDKPADADHQYGHGKVENFSAFIETGLLLLTCVWIVYESIRRLFFHSVEIEPSVAAFLVMFLSIAVDAWRSRALGRIADEVRQSGAGSRCAAFFHRHLVERGRDRGPGAGLAGAQLSGGVAAPGRSDCRAVRGGRGGFRELAAGAENGGCAARCGAGRRAQPDPRPDQDRRWRAGSGAGPVPESRATAISPTFRWAWSAISPSSAPSRCPMR